jgi:hypothetical protein
MPSKPGPVAGERVGMFVPIECVGVDKWWRKIWRCKCACGREFKRSAAAIIAGEAVSCGCYRRKAAREVMRARNARAKAAVEVIRRARDAIATYAPVSAAALIAEIDEFLGPAARQVSPDGAAEHPLRANATDTDARGGRWTANYPLHLKNC